jgi:nitrile hydratase accessory protein
MDERYQRRRNLVRRNDGRLVNVARPRGQLFVCADNCCCGRTEDGMPAVPKATYHAEWERRRLRNLLHLTVGGCLGPCALANVALLLIDGRALWFRELNSPALVNHLFDYAERLLDGDAGAPPPPLDALQFTASAWQERPDGQPVDDARPRRPRADEPEPLGCPVASARLEEQRSDAGRMLEALDGEAAAPRRNGELVFEAPWQGRAFGMAVALEEQQLYAWEEFRQRLIATIGEADAEGDRSGYYQRWLAAFEDLLQSRGVISREELDERTFQFEFGERDEVF